MPKKKLDITESIRKLEKLHSTSAEAQAFEAMGDPLRASMELSKVVEELRSQEIKDWIKEDVKFGNFMKLQGRELATETIVLMRQTIAALSKKLSEVEGMIAPKDLSGILGELGRQLKLLKEQGADDLPANEIDLDKEIQDLERSLDNERSLDS